MMIQHPGTPKPVQNVLQGFLDGIRGLDKCFDEGDIKCLRDSVANIGIAGAEAELKNTHGPMKHMLEEVLSEDKLYFEVFKKLPSIKNVDIVDELACYQFGQRENILLKYLNGH